MTRIESPDGVEYRNDAGELHRDGDLPAREYNDGSKYWYIERKRHRIDNPAVIWSAGKDWWLNGIFYYIPLEYYSNLYLYKGILLDTSTEYHRIHRQSTT